MKGMKNERLPRKPTEQPELLNYSRQGKEMKWQRKNGWHWVEKKSSMEINSKGA
jgi:hypothetical protein